MRGASGDDPDATDDVQDDDGPLDADEADGTREPADGTTRADDETSEAGDGITESTQETTEATDGTSDTAEGTDATTGGNGSDTPSRAATAEGDEEGSVEPDASAIDTAELTVSERSLHTRIRTIWIVRAVLFSLVLGAIAVAATWVYLDITPLAPAGLAAVLLVLLVAHAVLRYRAWQYEFRSDAIYLERGVLTRVRTVVPFVRIQHVDTSRGPIERVAGLSTLVVYTAGSRGADVTIPGIEAERATDHQRRLKRLAIAAEDDTAV